MEEAKISLMKTCGELLSTYPIPRILFVSRPDTLVMVIRCLEWIQIGSTNRWQVEHLIHQEIHYEINNLENTLWLRGREERVQQEAQIQTKIK